MSNIKPVEFSSNNNLFCLNGNFNQYQNSYRAVKRAMYIIMGILILNQEMSWEKKQKI